MTAEIPGVILAGGLATRMGGGDKGLIEIGGRALVDHVIARLQPQCSRLALNANGNPARFSSLSLPVLPDSIDGYAGPLAGVLAGLDWAASIGAEAIVTAAADTPFLPDDLVEKLRAAAGASGLALAASPDETGRMQRHPTFGLWPVRLRDNLRAALEGGLRKIVLWTDGHGAGLAAFPSRPFDPFFNVNTPEDVALAERMLAAASSTTELMPPRLNNDSFALPQGVSWIPVDEALARLRERLQPVTATETLGIADADGRVLAEDCLARRSNPPKANSAVDGYGFAAASTGPGVQRLPLVAGRAAAGQPFVGAVPPGSAIRILTGAILPEGVDTVVLEEDTASDGATIAFDGPIKPRSNTRRAGEDVEEGAVALSAGRRLGPVDIALLSALGVAHVRVRRRLRVGVLSTGDEIVADPAAPVEPHQIYDANRPMLLALARRWGHEVVDLGHARDREDEVVAALDRGARQTDVVITSGGASAGDEDHVARLLAERGNLTSWRVAIKPGRPLALAMWNGVPVFGLPGNPVAAFVCALVFASPALAMLSGAGWREAESRMVPAAFSKNKKAGRREYLRARLDANGHAEVFKSEGSGRISGLSWATGLVELPDEAIEVGPGTPVRFLPYSAWGL